MTNKKPELTQGWRV